MSMGPWAAGAPGLPGPRAFLLVLVLENSQTGQRSPNSPRLACAWSQQPPHATESVLSQIQLVFLCGMCRAVGNQHFLCDDELPIELCQWRHRGPSHRRGGDKVMLAAALPPRSRLTSLLLIARSSSRFPRPAPSSRGHPSSLPPPLPSYPPRP